MASKYDGLIDEVVTDKTAPQPPSVAKYGDIIDEITSSAPLQNSLLGASGTNPDQEAKNIKLSRELDTPVGILPADAEQQAQLKRVNAEDIKRRAQATATFLTNETNAKLTGLDGVERLAAMEAAYKTYSPENIKTFIKNYTSAGKSEGEAAQRLTQMKKQGINLADELDPYARTKADIVKDPLKAAAAGSNIMIAGANELGEQVGIIPRLVDLIFPDYGSMRRGVNASQQEQLNANADYWQGEKSPALQKLTKEFEQAGIVDSIGMMLRHPQLTADLLATSAPYLVPSAAAARGGEGLMLGYNALAEAGDAANSARQEAIAVGATPEQQNQAASIAMITTAPLAFLGNKLTGVGKLETQFFTKGSIGDTLLKAVVKEAISGAVEEGANKFSTNLGANLTYDDNRQLLEGVGKAAVIGGILESTHAVGMGAAERALRTFIKDIDQSVTNSEVAGNVAAQATAAHDTLETLGAQVAENDLRERSPEAFRAFVETMTDEQDLQDVYVDGKTMLAAIESDYVALKQQIPEVVARIEEAANLGNDVQLPVADYLTYIAGTPLEANVLGALKAEPDGVTYKDAQEFYNKQAELFQNEVQAVADTNGEVLTRNEFVAQKQQETVAPEQVGTTPEQQTKAEPLPATYEEYVAQHKNKREVYARDVKTVEDSLYAQFAEAKRFTPTVNRAYVAPLVEFYKTQAKKLGIQPSELFQQYPLKVQAFLNLTTGFELNQRGTRLEGLPTTSVGPDSVLQDTAVAYMNDNGWAYFPQTEYVTADPDRGARIAAEYEKMADNPLDPEVAMAYQALTEEVMAQYQTLKGLGYTFDLIPEGAPDPYAGGPREALLDMKDNKHLWVFPTASGYGQGEVQTSGSPMLALTNEYLNGTQLVVNDVFRIVHDVFGHAKDGFGFGPTGEENAWQSHVRMFTPVAARAMTTETRGQNSWVNYGPHGEANRANQKQTIYAEQKVGLLPEWVLTEGLSLSTNPAGRVAPIDINKIGGPTDAVVEDFAPENVKDILTKDNWVIMSSENPNADYTPEQNPERVAKFIEQLDAAGIKYLRTEGKYGNPEKSVLLFNVTPEEALALGVQWNQESVLTKSGFVYQDGSVSPATGVTAPDTVPNDYYTSVTLPDGRTTTFTVDINFDKRIPAGEILTDPDTSVYQSGKVGEVTIKGVHYSNQQREEIDGSHYGEGAKGAEADRVRASTDDRIKSRVHFYVDEGKGVFPEYGVGNTPHVVTLSNIYDAARNPLKLPKRDVNDPYNADGFNLFESAVLDAGFDGYYVENGFGRQGAAVMLGDAAKSVIPDAERNMFQTTTVRRGTETLKKYGLDPNKVYSTRDVAAALEARQRKKYGHIDDKDTSPEASTRIAKWMAEEVLFEMENPEQSGVGWYSTKFQEALDIMAQDNAEELLADPSARNLLTALIAITSDGQKISSNLAQAMEIYKSFFATDKLEPQRHHNRQASVDGNLEALQELFDLLGPTEVHEFLLQEKTVKELGAIAKEKGVTFNPSYSPDTKLPMAAIIFGPKLGAFYANLMGKEGYLTMDRWWSRTFNRYRGTLLTKATKSSLDKFRELLGQPDLSDDEVLSKASTYEAEYRRGGYKVKTELNKMGNTIHRKTFGTQDQPFRVTDRTFMIETARKAKEILAKKGVNMTIADIQAALWYYEKRLYGELGTRDSADISFADAARGLVAMGGDYGTISQGEVETVGDRLSVGQELYQTEVQGTFYSALTRAVSGIGQNKANAAQWKGIIKNLAGVKQDEIEAVGVNEWLDLQTGTVTKEELLAFLDANGVQVEEVMLGEPYDYVGGLNTEETARFNYLDEIRDTTQLTVEEEKERRKLIKKIREHVREALPTKYQTYVVGGQDAGKDYRELLLTLPEKKPANFEAWQQRMSDKYGERANVLMTAEEQTEGSKLRGAFGNQDTKYNSSHFDQKNILAHIRFDTRTDAEGNSVLFVNEIQSDWAQEGKKNGFKSDGLTKSERENFDKLKSIPREKLKQDQVSELHYYYSVDKEGVTPPAPFVTKTDAWVGLALKRIIRYAADNGFDKVAIINGQQAADLYDLSKQVEKIDYSYSGGDTWKVTITTKGVSGDWKQDHKHYGQTESMLENLIGKEITKKIVELKDPTKSKKLTGVDLKIGGEGMRTFYDQIVPKVAKDVLKKVGGSVETVTLLDFDENADKYAIVLPNGKTVHTTDSIKNAEANLEFFPTATIIEYKGDTTGQLGFTITPELKTKIQSGLPLFQGTRGSFNLETLTMTMLQGADLSTVIHESGHFYLKMLETLAARNDAPEEIKADYQKTLDWFGVSDMQWRTMGIEQQRPYHEQWAESFERWNIEGKAPTQALQPIFSRFRAWLLSVYKSVEEFVRLNPGAGKLNDEVRGVFSRLLAAQDAITATENARAYQPLYATAEEAGVSQEAFQNYINLGQDATQDAQDELQSRSLRDMKWLTNARNRALKELQATAKAVRAKTTLEVAREVADEPVYQALRFLRRGETRDPNTSDTIKIAEGYKLDKAILAEMYPETALDSPDLTELRGMTMTDGLSPDIVAQMFGLTSGDALVRELIAAENMNDKIEGLTDQRMLEEHGDLVDERSVQRAADEAVHNEARARFMATGLKMLTKSPISVTQMTKAAKQAAENVISNKRVRDVKPKQFLAAETRANKEVMKLVATKPEEAAEQQRVALLNNRLASAAHDAVTEVEKDLRYLGKFNNEGTRKNLDIDYLEQIDALLEPFDLRKGLSLSTIDARTSLTEWVAQQEAMGFEPTIDPAEVAEAKQKSYKNMKMSEMRALVDTIKQIEHMGRMKKKLLTAMEKADFLERINEAKLSIALNANRVVAEKGTPSDAVGVLGQWVRQMLAAHRKFTSFMRELDGAEWNGALYNLLVRPMGYASNTETQMKAEAAEKLADIFEPIRKKMGSFGNLYNRRRVVPGTNISMTNEQRVMFAMNWGNEGNRQRLLDGGITGKKAMSEAEARAVLDTLTKEEWDFVQNTWDFIATYRPLIEAQERQLTGKTPEWVEPVEVETKFGTYRGGYFPAKYDAVLSTRSDALEAVTDLRTAMKGAFGSSAARNGYTKARAAQVVGRPLLLNFNAISRHVNEVVHRLAWQNWLVDANRVVRALDGDFRTHLGAEATKEISDAIRDIALGDAPANTPVEVALNRVRTGTSIVGMGWSISTALLQPSGLSNSIARIGIGPMMKGLSRFVANPLEMSDWVNANSVLMQNRGRTMNREMNEILNTVRTGKGVSALTASYFYLIGRAQRMVDVPTYLGAYERALEEMQYEAALSEEERATVEKKAHDIAGQTVVDTQGGGEMKDLAKVQRGSPIYKLFTNFYSYMSTVYNQNVEAYRTTKFTSPVEVAAYTAEMILINFIPVAFSVLLKNALKGNCDWDDTECLVGRYKSEQVSHLFGQMVGLREIGVSVDALTGGEAYGYTGPAGLRFFTDLYKTAEQVNQGEVDMAAFKAINNATGALFHYPAGQLNKTLEGAIAIENGEVEGVSMFSALVAGAPK